MANPDVFDAYFRRADTDHDGQISGQEAVTFFLGANLPKITLAKIWQYADQGQTGFLSRGEFYNALKLVTVAQTGRELTPDIVRAALSEPTTSQIPAPRIITPGGPSPVAQPTAVRPASVPGAPGVPPSQQQYQQYGTGAIPNSQYMPTPARPNVPAGPQRTSSLPGMGTPAVGSTSEWPTKPSASVPSIPTANASITGQNFQLKANSGPPFQGQQDSFGGAAFQTAGVNDGRKPPSTTGAGLPGSDLLFGGDVFTATPTKLSAISSQPKPAGVAQTVQGGVDIAFRSDQGNLALVPTTQVPTTAPPPSASNQLQPIVQQASHSTPSSAEARVPMHGAASSGVSAGGQWPKLSLSDVQRYMRVFTEVDTDRDGKITGNQARDLFLSWRLAREVLKQIWDLSDQDGDSMLSLREFCTALYLMERFREGRTLPQALPAGVHFDESVISALRIAEAQAAVAQHSAGYNVPVWQQNPSVLQASGPALPGVPNQSLPQATAPGRMPSQAQPRMGDGVDAARVASQRSRAPVLEPNLVNQLNTDEQQTLKTKHKEAEDGEKKVQDLEKDIMDSKEKMEFYRSKLQEIILFKTRCDNRLNEITERAAADKREVESMAKRYDEKFKQAGESNSRLLTEESAFREVQERKMELYNAIVKIEQGGDTNTLLQSRADRIHSDLDELRKALNERCKRLNLRIKPTALIELPYGWQPGIQENAAQWDEDWDKFDDEGFVVVQDLSVETTGGSIPKPNAAASWDDNGLFDDGLDFSSANKEDRLQSEDSPANGHHGVDSPQPDSEDGSGRSGAVSPHHEVSVPSPDHHRKSSFGDSTAISKESQSNDEGPSSNSVGDTFGDGRGAWASVFSRNDDLDTDGHTSWGLGNTLSIKASRNAVSLSAKTNHSTSYGFGDSFDILSSPARTQDIDNQEEYRPFGTIRTKDRSSAMFDSSVPSTPLFGTTSPARQSNSGFFDDPLSGQDQFLRFDSFSSVRDSGHNLGRDSFTRFDSFSSVRDASRPQGFTSFDDSDPFADTGPFGAGGRTPKQTTDVWNAFN